MKTEKAEYRNCCAFVQITFPNKEGKGKGEKAV